MTVRFKESLVRDLRNIKDKGLLTRLRELIELVEQAQHLGQVANLKKLRGGDNYYRIRVGDYCIGLTVEADVVTFVRFLHRKGLTGTFHSYQGINGTAEPSAATDGGTAVVCGGVVQSEVTGGFAPAVCE